MSPGDPGSTVNVRGVLLALVEPTKATRTMDEFGSVLRRRRHVRRLQPEGSAADQPGTGSRGNPSTRSRPASPPSRRNTVHHLTRGACRALLTRASMALAVLCLFTVFLEAQAAAARSPSNDLDAFMARVLAGATSTARPSSNTSSTRPRRSRSSGRDGRRSIAADASSPGTCATACTSAARCASTASRSATRSAGSTRTTGSSTSASGSSGEPSGEAGKADEPRIRVEPPGPPVAGATPIADAAVRVRSLLHGLQVRAGQLLPRRPRAARRPQGAADRVLPDAHVQRRPTTRRRAERQTREATERRKRSRRSDQRAQATKKTSTGR